MTFVGKFGYFNYFYNNLKALPNGDPIMSGEGHKDWVAGLDFHPR